MPDGWLFALFEGNTRIEDVTYATSRSVTWRLQDAGQASFAMDGHSRGAHLIRELVSDLVVEYDGRPLWRGRVGAVSDDIDADSHTVQVSAVDYRGLLERRLLPADRGWLGTAPNEIGWQVIDATQQQPGGNLGITRGFVPAMAGRAFTAEWGESAAKVIDDASNMWPGFEWYIDHLLNYQGFSRGLERAWPLRWGTTVEKVSRSFDPSTYANVVRGSGKDEETTPVVRSVSDWPQRPEGRWETQVGNTDLTTQAAINAMADQELARRSTLAPGYSWTLIPGTWTPAVCWIGDYIPVQVKSGRLDVDTTDRISAITVKPQPSGPPDVDIETGTTIHEDVAVMLRRLPARLTDLNRR